MKQVKRFAAQGDVMFRRVKAVPEGYKPSDDHIVAHSETGHHHIAEGDLTVMRNDDPMLSYIIAKGDVQVKHHRDFDTHDTLSLLSEGEGEVIWEIRRQREHTPEGMRMVAD